MNTVLDEVTGGSIDGKHMEHHVEDWETRLKSPCQGGILAHYSVELLIEAGSICFRYRTDTFIRQCLHILRYIGNTTLGSG